VYEFVAELWLYPGQAGWRFITVPQDISDEIDERSAAHRHGFGSVPVRVRIGSSSWTTSLFPDKQRAAYLLPVRKPVRTAEGLGDGDLVTVTIDLMD
jgi:hypothetical protein